MPKIKVIFLVIALLAVSLSPIYGEDTLEQELNKLKVYTQKQISEPNNLLKQMSDLEKMDVGRAMAAAVNGLEEEHRSWVNQFGPKLNEFQKHITSHQ